MFSILPSQNNVTSVKLSDLNKLPNAVAKLLPKLFHLRQNCCCESIPDVDWNVFAEIYYKLCKFTDMTSSTEIYKKKLVTTINK